MRSRKERGGLEARVVRASARGIARWRGGHPWIYRSDVDEADCAAGLVHVHDRKGRAVGWALWSPTSEIRLRMLTSAEPAPNGAWWRRQIRRAHDHRRDLAIDATAYREVHAEADGLPSLVVDRYGDVLVAQILSAGLEAVRTEVIEALVEVLEPAAILLRNDAQVRRHESLPLEVTPAFGSVPDEIEVHEAGIRYVAPLRSGQKTGAFLDQRENRALAGAIASGRALDAFCYHGLFSLHMAGRATSVLAVDSSAPALAFARRNAERNGHENITWVEANVFDTLRELERASSRFDTIVLDPPAFAKQKGSVERATAAYKEINLRSLKLLAPGGRLLTCSCSFHLGRGLFFDMLADAARDSRRRVTLERILGQSADHPEVLGIPETAYLKGALLRVDA